jgi:FeS assembly SUF system protein
MPQTTLESPEKMADAISSLGDRIVAQLKEVFDPEIPVNIFDLGLIYKIDADPLPDGTFDVVIDMTLTTPNCPVAGQMPAMVQQAVGRTDGVRDVKVNLVWEPSWDKAMMTDEARMQLNMF